MVKKILTYILLSILFTFQLVGCTSLSKESKDEIKEIAYNWLDDNSKASIIDAKKVAIEETSFNNKHLIATHSGLLDIKGKVTYKVTFATTDDEILGPIVIYLHKDTMEVLGIDFRD